MARIVRAPEGTEFENDEGHPWMCLNCGRVATDPKFCDYCQFPRFNQVDDDDPERWLPDPYKPGHDGEVTRDTPPTPAPEGANPGSHGGML